MHYDFISDLHVDTWPAQPDWKSLKRSDILVLAGDICTRDMAGLVPTLQELAGVYDKILFVAGNNDEHFAFDVPIRETYVQLREKLATIPNLIDLATAGPFVVGDTAFAGVTGWHDFRFLRDGAVENLPAQDLTQENLIDVWARQKKLPVSWIRDMVDIAEQEADALAADIAALQKNGAVKNIVVVTHHVPQRGFIDWDLKRSLDAAAVAWNSTSGNSRLRTALQADTQKKIKTWLFGHNHVPKRAVIDGVVYTSNPRGTGNFAKPGFVYKPLTLTPAGEVVTAAPVASAAPRRPCPAPR